MNKKGEAFTMGVIALLIVMGALIVYEKKAENEYMGDMSTRMAYNLKSRNPACDLEEIKIQKENITLFRTELEVRNGGFNISQRCP